MRKIVLLGFAGMVAMILPMHVASAWTHSGTYMSAEGGGGSWDAHNAYGGSAEGGGGSWSARSAYGGTAEGGEGSWTAEGANGSTAYGGYHAPTTVYGTSLHYGGSYYGYYHPPTTVNYYSSGCSNCGGWNAGAAAAAGLVTGAAIGAAQANANTQVATANAYSAGVAAGAAAVPPPIINDVYATLPANCQYTAIQGANYYRCGATWLEPAFGANGVYYRVIPVP